MQLHFREYGRGSPLIILHGLFGSLENWETVSRKLSDQFHVFAVDQRNHGHSPHSPEMNYAVMAEDLREFLQKHGLSIVSLLGHSMGGKTAMQFALRHPEKVEGLIVVDIAPRRYPPAHDGILKSLLALDVCSFQNRLQADEALAFAIPDIRTRRFLLKNLARDSHGVFYWKFNLPGLQQNYGFLTAPPDATGVFEKPTLFIRGGKSDYIRDEDWPEIRRLFPHAEAGKIANAGHWVQADAPEIFLTLVKNFFHKIF